MADFEPINKNAFKPKSFWKRPEGTTGTIVGLGILAGLGFLIFTNIGLIYNFIATTVGLVAMLVLLAAIIYMVLDPKMRNLVWYMYKSVMRWITGLFVTIDPIGILKNYIDDLQNNLKKMSTQIGNLRGQMRKLKDIMSGNNKEIEKNMLLASQAKKQGKDQQVILSSRKAARLKESNEKYNALHNKMEVMYRILTKMYQNSEVLLEDTKDQVAVKEVERKAIRTSHSAMKSAMSVISGDPDKRAMFDAAMENITTDVANKVGEMERFMEMSANLMDSIDLQQGVFEDQGMAMLEKWEKESTLMLLGEGKEGLTDSLDLNQPRREKLPRENSGDSSYENLFD